MQGPYGLQRACIGYRKYLGRGVLPSARKTSDMSPGPPLPFAHPVSASVHPVLRLQAWMQVLWKRVRRTTTKWRTRRRRNPRGANRGLVRRGGKRGKSMGRSGKQWGMGTVYVQCDLVAPCLHISLSPFWCWHKETQPVPAEILCTLVAPRGVSNTLTSPPPPQPS